MQTKHLFGLILIWTKGEVGSPLNRFKPFSKIFYWPFQGGTSFVDLVCFFLSCVCYACVRICLYVPCGHLLGKDWPLGSRLWCITESLLLSHLIGILGQVWYLILSILIFAPLLTLKIFTFTYYMLIFRIALYRLIQYNLSKRIKGN